MKSDPSKAVPREALDGLPSLFLDKDKLKKVKEEVRAQNKQVSHYASDQTLRACVHMAALGVPNSVIARSLGIPRPAVASMLGSTSVRLEIERLQSRYFARDAEQMFKRLVPAAVQVIFDLMTKKAYKESTRLEAGKYIVDRALGKPKETVETKTDLISQVFVAIQKEAQDHAPAPKQTDGEILDAIFERVEPNAPKAPNDPEKDPLASL